MKRFATAIAVALAIAAPTAAHAQIAAAIGQPLPASDLDAGTVSVRVIAGSPSKPIVGTDVTLVVNGTPRQARSDSAGRAIFKDLPAGATVKASVVDEDKKEWASSEFVLADTGVRVMLSTKPFEPGGGGAPFAGGAGGAMPEPRQMSGQARAEASDSPGTITVRLTYDDFKDAAPPANVPVLLVGYRADETYALHVVPTDKDGRAQFTSLDIKGETSYFAMAQLPRNGAIDRLASLPCVLDSHAGVRLVLSADKRDSNAPPIDDLNKVEKQDHPGADHSVHVVLEGVPDPAATVRLVALSPDGTHRVLGQAPASRAEADPTDVVGQSSFEQHNDMPAHAVHVQVHGGGGVNEPLGGVNVVLVPAKQVKQAEAGMGVKTPEGGELDLTDASNAPVVAEVTINGKVMRSKPFDLSQHGGVLDMYAQWESQGKLVADIDASAAKPDEAMLAETTMRGLPYRSAPLQPIAGKGSEATIYVFPRVMFSFSLTSHIDDEFLAVQGRFQITNNAWAPYIGGADGLVIPLPEHFRGAIVAEQDQGDVAVAQGAGFRIARPIPPGGKQFHAGFSLPVQDGTVHWALDLPLGAYESGMEILQTPGMVVQTPPSVKGEVATAPQGTFYVLPSISILPKQSMEMTISNLPSPPAWRKWAPRITGAIAIMIMLAGLGFALARTTATRALHHERLVKRNKLLDELVALEPGGKSDKRRAQITDELEQLWDE
ncbi:MAG TPA: hypothetical protein VH143_07560 [Kofleriaceae bacterium]|jgi:hypothetical protein|nr:hypothetical protein [Kofleriaceae bacterium]